MYVQPFDGQLAQNSLSSLSTNADGETPYFSGPAATGGEDNISRFVPPWYNEGGSNNPYDEGYGGSQSSMQGLFAPLMGMMQQMMQMLQSLMGYGGCTQPGRGGSPSCGGGSQYFQNATASSEGDPHLSFDGAHWNSMTSHPDLLNSNSFPGGFAIATQVTQPNAKGITRNQSATISLDGGATTVGLNNERAPTITNYGQPVQIARGQTLQLGNGQSVTYEADGALRVDTQNDRGGQLVTTLTARDGGVNVEVDAHNVDLGGALVRGYDRENEQPGRYAQPVFNPLQSYDDPSLDYPSLDYPSLDYPSTSSG